MFTSFARLSLRSSLRSSFRCLPIVLGAGYALRPRPIFNDAMASQYSPVTVQTQKPSALKKKLNYDDLCVGSLTGLFLGIIVGKLSTALAFLAASTYLFLQFLESRGIVTIPWTSVINMGKRRIDLHSLFFENSSFKLSFVSTFLLAAWNI